MDKRATKARQFLTGSAWQSAKMMLIAGDASARRYFRLMPEIGETAILMDAPPPESGNIGSFLGVADLLRNLGLSAPRMIKADVTAGFVLMEDLGDALYAHQIALNPTLEQQLYETAVDVLVKLDAAPVADWLPAFDATTMSRQISPVYDWYLRGVSDRGEDSHKSAFQAELEAILCRYCEKTPRMLLRDYHAENLIWLSGRSGVARVGLLDFQDAMSGPAGYDLVSLLLDARRDVAPDVANATIARFVADTNRDFEQFSAAFAAIGLQRNLRILGVFARLCLAHGKPRYIAFMPRVWGHVQACLSHPALASLASMAQDDLPAPTCVTLKNLRDKCATLQIP